MDNHDVEAIRETIALAKQHEAETGHLAQLLRDEVPSLHNAIRLPDDQAVDTLLDFISRYIEHVPDFLDAIAQLTKEAGIGEYTFAFLDIARDYFLKPPEVMKGHTGMDALLDEAYLAHRLMEEVNDRFMGRCGIPLAPMDMTRANLIAHHLIGDQFANELDMAVQYSIELLMNQEAAFDQPQFKDYIEEHRERGWSHELKRWPCLAEDLDISLSFSQPQANDEKSSYQAGNVLPSNVVKLH